MQTTIHIWMPHVRDGLIVANVGIVTTPIPSAITTTNRITKTNQAAIPPSETR